jgi:uncharacterized membrane protein YkoI
MERKTRFPAVIVAVGMAAAAGLALAKPAAEIQKRAAADLAKATISLSQAVGAAEAQAGGRATRAELERKRGGVVVYNVEVVTADNKVFDVKIDATDGKVLSSKLDQADCDDDEED